MLKKYWKNAISLILVVALLIGILPAAAHAQDVLPTDLECDTQTGMSTIYEYQPFDIGRAGTAYVNTYLCTLHVRRSDLSLGGNRLPVTIEFYHDADNALDADSTEVNPYGNGWTTAYNQLIRFDADTDEFAYKNENGTWIYFADSGTTTDSGKEIWTEQTTYGIGATGAELHLETNATQTNYASIDVVCNGVHHSFDSAGRLVKVESDANQIAITYVPNSQYKIREIADSVGRRYCFSYSSDNSNGVLEKIACKTASDEAITSGNTQIAVTYGINNGFLTSVAQSNGDAVAYTYDNHGRITAAANVDGCGYAFVYSGDSAVVTSVIAKAGMGTALEESGSVVIIEKPSAGETTVTSDDMRQEYTFDQCGRVTGCELLTRSQGVTTYSASSGIQYTCVYGFNLVYGYVTNEDGTVTNDVIDVTIYDANGVIENEPEATEPEETEPEETEPEETEPFDYSDTTDAYGNVLSETNTEGTLHQTTTYTYSDDGNYMTSKTDENGNTQQYVYNTDTGLLEALVDGNGNQTNYTYNAMRELSTVHLNVNGLVGSASMDASYTYEKDRLTQLDYGAYHYGFQYDIWGNVLSVTMNGAPLVSYDYGDNASKGMVETLTYGNGQQVFYTYNALGQVESAGYTDQISRFQYAYAADGSLSGVYDSETQETTTYTENGYQIKDADNHVLYAYSSAEDGNYTETVNGATYQATREYQNGATVKQIRNSSGANLLTAKTVYGAFDRLYNKRISTEGIMVSQDYTYATGATGNTGSFVENYYVTYSAGNHLTDLSFAYTYDGNGNITRIDKTESSGNGSILDPQPPVTPYSLLPDENDGETGTSSHITYEYDKAGQLTKAVDSEAGITYRYTYDAMGNIRTAQKNANSVTVADPVNEKKTFHYMNGILSGYTTLDGTEVSYQTDAMGNPVQIGDYTLTWGEGRMLTSITLDESNQSTYTYNADGLRASKQVAVDDGKTVVTRYIWGNYGLAAAITDDQTVVVLYDDNGEAIGFSVDGDVYTYVKNLQGDVLRIIDNTGTAVVAYTYDPWGVPTVSGDTDLAAINPCSYRGYYYDQETSLYYVSSRYYDPEIGRFLNSDEPMLLGTNGTVVGFNLFTYCENNPVNYKDPSGYGPVGTIIGGILGFGLGALLVPRVADLLKLKGWGRKVFICAGVAALTGLGACVGNYVGEAIFAIYKAGGAFALKINRAIANGIAKIVGGSLNAASGNGWVIKVGKLTLRIMTSGGGRTNYFRLSHITKGALTILGAFSGDRGLTHIPITFNNIIKIVQLILKLK